MGQDRFLLTGATGFVGSLLLEQLREAGTDVRVFVRDPDKLDDTDGLDVVAGDLDDTEALARAMDGVSCAYYLVHSMGSGEGDEFAKRDRELASKFVEAADRHGVPRVVYLGGIIPPDNDSEHLDSRREVEEVFANGDAELVSLRASMIVGARSASFRTLAEIVDRLPVLPLPDWRRTRTQPVAVADVVAALAAADDVAPGVYDLAGPDELSVEDMVGVIGRLTGGEPKTIPIPGHWAAAESAGAATVADAERAMLRPLFAGLEEDLLVERNDLDRVFGVTPTPFEDAARSALSDILGDDAAPGETVGA